MVRAISSFMEFCYLVHRSILDDDDLDAIDAAVADFHRDRVAFNEIHPDGYSLPRQHSIVHYRFLIQEFGAPNGLCSSITESKHIKAVKEPWRRSSRFEALGQMLLTNQRLDKLAAARVNFQARGMLTSSIFARPDPQPLLASSTQPIDDEDDDGGGVDGNVLGEVILAKKPRTSLDPFMFFKLLANFFFLHIVPRLSREVTVLAGQLGLPELPNLIRRFLYQQENPELIPLAVLPLDICPTLSQTKVYVYPSAIATYFAPSDKSGTKGMFREQIRAVDSWRKGPPRHDCVFVEQDSDLEGFRGLLVARVRSFLSIRHNKISYPCALISWYSAIGNEPCPNTKMWKVQPDLDDLGQPILDIIHLDTTLRNAHLMGVCDDATPLPYNFKFYDSLDSFKAFYVNKYIDYHAHEIVF